MIYLIACVTIFSLMDAIAKSLGTRVDVSQILWARYGGQLLAITIIFAPKLRGALRTDVLGTQIIRGLLQLGAAGCFFTAVKELGLTEATAVADLAPVLITLGAALFLREKVGARRAFGVAAALIGALIVIRPGTDVFTPASFWPLGTAACLGAYALITRHIGRAENPLTPLLYSGLVCTAIMSLIVPFRWVTPDLPALLLMGVIGLVGTMGQLMMIRAYATAEASAIAPFTYAGLITASFWGLLFFGDLPDLWTIVGALVIVAAGLYVWHRERLMAKHEDQTR